LLVLVPVPAVTIPPVYNNSLFSRRVSFTTTTTTTATTTTATATATTTTTSYNIISQRCTTIQRTAAYLMERTTTYFKEYQ
jgi:hypothetical protein